MPEELKTGVDPENCWSHVREKEGLLGSWRPQAARMKTTVWISFYVDKFPFEDRFSRSLRPRIHRAPAKAGPFPFAAAAEMLVCRLFEAMLQRCFFPLQTAGPAAPWNDPQGSEAPGAFTPPQLLKRISGGEARAAVSFLGHR